MPDDVSVAVTGASGFVARNLRRSLAGMRLLGVSRGIVRPVANEKPVRTDYSSHKQLASKLRSCDVLVHLVGIGKSGDRSAYADVNANLTSVVVKAAKLARVRQVIFLSGLGVSQNNPNDYFASKFRAEKIIRESGMDYTIFRPSFILGKNDYLTQLLNRQVRSGRVSVPGNGGYVLQPISIHDVVKIIRDSFGNKRFLNKTLDLVGPDTITFADFVKLFCRNRPAKVSRVPLETCLHRAFADPKATYGLDDLNLFYGGYVGNFERLRRAYGGTIRPVREILQSEFLP